MPRTAVDYQKTIIYQIVCNDLSITELYVGSTTNFTERKYAHKKSCKTKDYKIYTLIRANGGWENWSMVEIEKYPCADGNEARRRERHWIEELNAKLNTIRPIRTTEEVIEYMKEYRETHKEQSAAYNEANKEKNKERYTEYNKIHKDQRAEYYEANKEKIKEQHNAYYETHKEQKAAYNEANKERIRERKAAAYQKKKEKNKI